MFQYPIDPRDAWREARRALLDDEKALSRQQDALDAARQRLSRLRIERNTALDTRPASECRA